MIISVNEIFNFYDLYKTSWGGAIKNLDLIKYFCKKYNCNDSIFYDYLNETISDVFNGSIDRTRLNDLLWFDDDYIEEFLNNNNPEKEHKDYIYWYEELNDYINK